MGNNSFQKKLGIGALAVIFLGGIFFFRGQISSFLNFGEKITEKNDAAGNGSEVNTNILSENTPTPNPNLSASGQNNRTDLAARPMYEGRPLSEVRFNGDMSIWTAAQKDNYSSDIKKYAAAIQETPKLYSNWMQLALLKKGIGDYEGARDIWEYVKQGWVETETAIANLGQLYQTYLKDYPKAEMNLNEAVKKYPDHPSGYIALAEFYARADVAKFNRVEEVLLQGFAKIPEDSNIIRALAMFYESRNQYEKALEWWKKTLEKEPENASIKAKIEEIEKKIKPPTQ